MASPRVFPVAAGFVALGGGAVSEGLFNALLVLLGVSTAAGILSKLNSGDFVEINVKNINANSAEARAVLEQAESQANYALTEEERNKVKAYFPSRIDNTTNNVVISPKGMTLEEARIALSYGDVFTINANYAKKLSDETSPIRESVYDNPHYTNKGSIEQYFPHYHPLKIDPHQGGKK